MLASDQTLVSNRSSQTLPGADSSLVYAEVLSGSLAKSARQVTAVALTTPKKLIIEQRNSGSGLSARRAVVVRHEYSDLSADPALYGGVVPQSAVTVTINFPAVGSAITAAIIKTQIGVLMDLLLISGNTDALLGGAV
jgi:hypothetical protein